jgi:hypothetical protein
MLSGVHFKRSDMLIRDIIARMRHDGCDGMAGGAARQHRGRQQPTGAADRTDQGTDHHRCRNEHGLSRDKPRGNFQGLPHASFNCF